MARLRQSHLHRSDGPAPGLDPEEANPAAGAAHAEPVDSAIRAMVGKPLPK